MDGGAFGTLGKLTGGGVFRDNFGVFQGCFAVTHGRGYTFEAELATTLYAIEIAYDKGWTNIRLESDSTYVVHILKSSHHEEGNAVADRLMREEVYSFGWWSEPPEFLIPFLQKDIISDFYRFSLF
ncbi:hypothetical protein ACS0TY_006251 [Phlomoides rotata]